MYQSTHPKKVLINIREYVCKIASFSLYINENKEITECGYERIEDIIELGADWEIKGRLCKIINISTVMYEDGINE